MDRRTFLSTLSLVGVAPLMAWRSAPDMRQANAVDAGPCRLWGHPVFLDAHCAQSRFFVVPDALWDESEYGWHRLDCTVTMVTLDGD